MSPTIRSCRGTVKSVASFSVSGNSVARRSATVCSAVVAWRGDTVSFKRANTCTDWAPRASGARSRGLKMSGCQNSAAAGNRRAAGATPTIVTVWPSSVVVELTTSGRPPNRRRQRPFARTT